MKEKRNNKDILPFSLWNNPFLQLFGLVIQEICALTVNLRRYSIAVAVAMSCNHNKLKPMAIMTSSLDSTNRQLQNIGTRQWRKIVQSTTRFARLIKIFIYFTTLDILNII